MLNQQMIKKLLIIVQGKILIKLFFQVTKVYYSFKLLINYYILIDLSESEFKKSFYVRYLQLRTSNVREQDLFALFF